MNVLKTEIDGVFIIEPKIFNDSRGWFMESYSKIKLPEINVDFVQDNHSYSANKGILRGIHFQKGAYAQAKLVRCISGKVLDVAIDLRKGSSTYKRWVSIELSAENKTMFFIPRGFGHGFVTLTDHVEFVYKTDNYYNYENDRSIRYNDPELNIDWGMEQPILSDGDLNAPLLKNSDCDFIYEKQYN